MQKSELSKEDLDEICVEPKCSAQQGLDRVPNQPGYYAIYVNDATLLPKSYSDVLSRKDTKLIYIGIAKKLLKQRLIKQDLRHQGSSTFFRSIGAILGYRPTPGSLIGKSNQQNYKFDPIDTARIVSWINENLAINWLEESPADSATEKTLILSRCPLINIEHNPEKLAVLEESRLICRTIAQKT
jgi:hypothetical protein